MQVNLFKTPQRINLQSDPILQEIDDLKKKLTSVLVLANIFHNEFIENEYNLIGVYDSGGFFYDYSNALNAFYQSSFELELKLKSLNKYQQYEENYKNLYTDIDILVTKSEERLNFITINTFSFEAGNHPEGQLLLFLKTLQERKN